MPTFYCYSRCSTCKKAQKWLDDHQVAYDQNRRPRNSSLSG